MSGALRRKQEGQILVLVAAALALLFLPLSVFVIDTALVESAYAQLGDTLQASAEDGASTIDEQAFRGSAGQRVVLDPASATATSERSLQASQMPGLDFWTVSVRGDTVTATATLHVRLLLVGTAALTESRSASFHYGP
jgi:hypothetical protein